LLTVDFYFITVLYIYIYTVNILKTLSSEFYELSILGSIHKSCHWRPARFPFA
jgi:hypothetical protein